jgi:hypothetical protein
MSKYTDGFTVIGSYVLTKPKVFRKLYEFAAWHTDITVPAGEYPLYARVRDGKIGIAHDDLRVELPGVVTSSDLRPHFGGNPFGSTGVNEDVGKAEVYRHSNYGWQAAKDILMKDDCPYRLNPEYLAKIKSFEHTWYDDRKKLYNVSAGISAEIVAA